MKLGEILSGPQTWCQGALYKDGKHCLVGALAALSIKEPLLHMAHELDRLQRLAGIGVCDAVFRWNDAPERRWEDVQALVEAFDRDRLLNP